MERVIVLGLSGCKHCDSLVVSLSQEGIPFEFIDADKDTRLADRMEALLRIDHYPMVIVEKLTGSVYLYRVDDIEEAREGTVAYAKKIGCVSTDSMVAITKKYIK